MDTVKNSHGKRNEVENEDRPGDSKAKKSRTKDPGVRKVGNIIYDSKFGNTCHQCRQKTTNLAVKCTNMIGDKLCTLKFCQSCLANRYGQHASVAIESGNWICPRCRGNCNCSFCRKDRGLKPTGNLTYTAKAKGYTCVSEMIEATESSVPNLENSLEVDENSLEKRAAQEMVEPKVCSSSNHHKGSLKEEEDGPRTDHSSPMKRAAQEMVEQKASSSPNHDKGSREEEEYDLKVDHSPPKKLPISRRSKR